MKKYAVLKYCNSELFGLHLHIVKFFDTYDEAKELIETIKNNLLNRGMVEFETNLYCTMYNPLNEIETNSYEIQEINL